MSDKVLANVWNLSTLPANWFIRQVQTYKHDKQLEKKIQKIITNVIKQGDHALLEATKRYDNVILEKKDLLVSPKEIQQAYSSVDEYQIAALKQIKQKINSFEKLVFNQGIVSTSMDDIVINTFLSPIESVGCYIPGGHASYPSTLIMTVIPAKVAGVSRIVVCSPPRDDGCINPLVLVAADICGVDEIYKVGGAQAVAALAYGTNLIKPVKKIVGPGNKYVAMAKILVSKDAAIDMPAGPSEILIVADKTANPKFIALDMISQAEHGYDSSVGLITTSEKLRDEVQNWLVKILKKIDRSDLVLESLKNYGFIITCESITKAIELTNIFAPEHLELLIKDSKKLAKNFTTAGLILIGPFSPVALSDYGSGTNHVLPTGGYSQVFSGLCSLDFARRINIVEGSKKGLIKLNTPLKIMTEAENLPNHYEAIKARIEND